MFGFNQAKAETQGRLAVARIKLQRNKKTIAVKAMRKEIAELLRQGKQEYARIRVEGVIRENLMMGAYEILELYLELLAMRSQLVAKTKEIPRDMVEAVSSIIYAAQRISDIPELGVLRSMFASKYGKEYAQEASSDTTCSKWQVNPNLIRCLLVEPPQPEEKLAMLSDIAQEAGVEWDLSAAARELLPPGAQPGGGGGGAAGYYAPPPAPGMQVQPGRMDPQQAAAAAAAAAAHAKAMADYAAQLARQQQQPPHMQGPPPPQPPQPSLATHSGSLPGTPVGPPPSGWLVNAHQNPLPFPAPSSQGSVPAPHSGSSSAAPPPAPVIGVPAGSSAPVVVPGTHRTEEDIQRAYDAAIGPPAKPGLNTAASAPLRPPSASDGSQPGGSGGQQQQQQPNGPPGRLIPAWAAPDSMPGNSNLPSPPVHLPSPPAAILPGTMDLPRPPQGTIPPTGPDDEYDELTRRLDALKRS